jgi:hypothetical protein
MTHLSSLGIALPIPSRFGYFLHANVDNWYIDISEIPFYLLLLLFYQPDLAKRLIDEINSKLLFNN